MTPRALTLAAALCCASFAHAAAVPDFVPDVDKSLSACTDFNAWSNNNWIKANPIPSDKSRWGGFDALAEKSLNAQRSIVEAAAKNADSAKPGSIEQKIGWIFRAAMDEAAIERAGFDPIKKDLAAIASLKTSADVVAWLQHAHARAEGRTFGFGVSADYKNAKRQIAFASQGGLGLPGPEYYSKDEYAKLRDAYVAHIAKHFELTGTPAEEAKARAALVMALETKLAAASLLRVELRKPENQYNFVSIEQANKITPHWDWASYFKVMKVDAGVANAGGFSLSQPKFFAAFDALLAEAPVAQWQAYFSFHAIDGAANSLSKAFQDENFAFYGKTINGTPEQEVRWKRALGAVNGSMGQALGQLYVKEYFPPEAKARAQELVDNVRNALKARIENLDWMSPETKTKAIAKWATFLPKIGYPDNWRDWSGLQITADSHYANVRAARVFNQRFNLAKIGKETDRYEWGMTPQTVNAYYQPSTNTINFPAAILQPPFFYAKGDDAINYGGIGAVIGHEAGHGFDDQGSQFDGEGNNANWWTAEDRKRFDERANKLVAQADEYAPLANYPDKKVNGRMTLGENIGDLGGLNMAYDAMVKATAGKPDAMLDGMSRDQRFFMNWAKVWAGSIRDQAQLTRLNTDVHSPAGFRANGAPSNMPAFAKAYGCKVGDPMVRPDEKRVVIW
ncbi:M13 family metallopeptidase [Pelomonas sp. V22]|uniref:M13 family metallopeptidase n=1 Tax=Pelomonas sp. V22 TaxID=2822139 RepID=UPI0024A964C9|nr:M13 family metallopeptidase [Pelomonas sp. V22]MDI4635459.1 M13 family metallopeptidase [Pelomonas sp. V22]